jgi:putative methyltransferase (TIGR04325 family)
MNPRLKKIIKEFIPPILLRLRAGKCPSALDGNFSSWDEAVKVSTGYDSEIIFNRVKEAALKVNKGEAICERDSVLFDEIQYSWAVLAGLLKAAVGNSGRLSVLDFGGSLGSSYFQCRGFLKELKELRWNIVEQHKFVNCGRELFENEHLRFYFDVEECLKHEKPDVVLFSSVIQYITDPYRLIESIVTHNFRHIIFDITPFHWADHDIITVQHVPPSIYPASYPFRIFSLDNFLDLFIGKYEKLAQFHSLAFPPLNDRGGQYLGFIFERLGPIVKETDEP